MPLAQAALRHECRIGEEEACGETDVGAAGGRPASASKRAKLAPSAAANMDAGHTGVARVRPRHLRRLLHQHCSPVLAPAYEGSGLEVYSQQAIITLMSSVACAGTLAV